MNSLNLIRGPGEGFPRRYYRTQIALLKPGWLASISAGRTEAPHFNVRRHAVVSGMHPNERLQRMRRCGARRAIWDAIPMPVDRLGMMKYIQSKQ